MLNQMLAKIIIMKQPAELLGSLEKRLNKFRPIIKLKSQKSPRAKPFCVVFVQNSNMLNKIIEGENNWGQSHATNI